MNEEWKWLCRLAMVSSRLRAHIFQRLISQNEPNFWVSQLKHESYLELKNAIPSTRLEYWWTWKLDNGVHCVGYWDEEYPQGLREIQNPPPLLWYLGAPVWKKQDLLGVVGSRRLTFEAEQWMKHFLPPFFRKHQLGTNSGGARGVDELVHWLSITERIPTIVHLPVGLMHRYPLQLKHYEKSILLGGGAIVSGFLPEVTLRKANFQIRNWWIAAMSAMVLITLAREKGGTMITANAAADLGRPVGVVPWSALDPQGKGCLELLYNGAQMIRDDSDLALFWQEKTNLFIHPERLLSSNSTANGRIV